MMTNDDIESFPQYTSDGNISVERTFELRDTGAVSTVVVNTEGDYPAVFRLFDTIPEAVEVADVGFKSDAEPLGGEAEPSGVSLEAIVRPGEPETFVYGFSMPEPKLVREFDALSIEKSIRMDDDDVEEDEPDELPIVRGASQAASGNVPQPTETPGDSSASPKGFLRQFRQRILGRETASVEGDPAEEEPPDEPTRGMKFGQDGDENEGEGEAAVQSTGDTSETDDPETALDSLFADVDDTAPMVDDDEADEDSLVAELHREIREGTVPEEDIEGLREVLNVNRSSSADVRVSYLQSRIDRLDAYTDALEELIDKHGTGTEIVDRLLDKIENLQEEIDRNEEELNREKVQRRESESRLAALGTRTDDLESELEGLEKTLDRQEALYHRKVDELSDRLSSKLENGFDSVDEDLLDLRQDLSEEIASSHGQLEADLAELKEEVDRNSKLRQRLVEVATMAEELGSQGEGDALRSRLNDASTSVANPEQPGESDAPEGGSIDSN